MSGKNNPFTLSFGNAPKEYIARIEEKEKLERNIKAQPPLAHAFVITGIRGAGKTVMLTSISDSFKKDKDWIVIELNPSDDMREALAAKLYSACHLKKLFLEKNFNFSFKGISFSISGKNPVLNIDDLLDKMFEELHKQNKKVLVLVDEVTNNDYMKQFALSFQILIRQNYEVFLLVTSLFENISSIENEKNLTFLIRAPKTSLASLNLTAIANSYEENLEITREKALEFAKETKGYAFAFQLLGYLAFENNSKMLDKKLLNQFDQYLESYAYNKIWTGLSPVEQNILKEFRTNGNVRVGDILVKAKMTKEYFSKYRARLLDKGIVVSTARGQLTFALPRFKEFIDTRIE